jgi:hypothetical protein
MLVKRALLLFAVVLAANGLGLQLTAPRTCFDLQVDEEREKMMVNYHHNLMHGTAAMKIYYQDGRVLANSGEGN